MAELGECLMNAKAGKERKFSSVNVTKILRSDKDSNVQEFLMGKLPFQKADATAAYKQEFLLLNKKLSQLQGKLEIKQKEIDALKTRMIEVKKEAHKSGVLAGKKEGINTGRQEAELEYGEALNQVQNRVANVLEKFHSEKSEAFVRLEKDFVDVTIACIKKVFKEIAIQCETGIVPILQDAMQAVSLGTSLVLKVNPEDFRTADKHHNLWMPLDREYSDIKLEPDNRIHRGSCRLETENTTVEMNLDSIINNIKETLTKVFAERVARSQYAGSDDGDGPSSMNATPQD